MTRHLFLAIALVASAAVNAQPVSLTGPWTVSTSVSGTQTEQACNFTQKDLDLTGTCKSERGSVEITGKIDARSVTWQYDTEYEGQKLTAVYNGTIEGGDKIAGSVDVRGMGVSGEFSATRVK